MLSTIARKAKSSAFELTTHYPSPVEPLAQPPVGSDLVPVMGQQGAPIIGYSLVALMDVLKFARKNYETYGPVGWAGLMGRKVVVAIGPDAAQAILLDKEKTFSAEKGWMFMIGPFFHGGVMLMDYDEHIYHRRILQQAFTRTRLVGYLDLMTPGITRGLDSWQPGHDFPLYSNTKQLLLELATEVFVGTELGPQAKRLERAFEDAVRGGQAVIRTNVPGGMWSKGLRGRKVLADYFRRELPAKRNGGGNDLFSVLCHAASEEGHTFTDEEIVDHMIFVLMAAHDTSTLALSMMGYLLGKHPEWQVRLRAESLALGKPTLDYDDLDRLPSLDLVFKETLRMFAPVGQQLRETLRDTELLGHFIPAGTPVMYAPYPSMRMEQWWSNPDVFDPERFARHEEKSHRYAWSPFGGGAHKCIGQQFANMTVKGVMHQMLLRYRWSVPSGYELPLGWGTGPTPVDGLPIHLKALTAVERRQADTDKQTA